MPTVESTCNSKQGTLVWAIPNRQQGWGSTLYFQCEAQRSKTDKRSPEYCQQLGQQHQWVASLVVPGAGFVEGWTGLTLVEYLQIKARHTGRGRLPNCQRWGRTLN